MDSSLALTSQWNDFLVRKFDPYAQAKYEILLDWMGEIKGRHILVVGCGSGEFCAYLARKGAHVVAIDVDQHSVDLTVETAKALGVSLDTMVARLEDYPETRQFDVVVATDVIEHIEDDQGATKKMRRLLKPLGTLILTVPALQPLMGYHDEILGHFRRYSSTQLRKLIQNDFYISQMRYYGFFLIPVAYLVSRVLRRPYPVSGLEEAKQKSFFVRKLSRFYFRCEQKFHLGLGTSLLVMAQARENPLPSPDRPG